MEYNALMGKQIHCKSWFDRSDGSYFVGVSVRSIPIVFTASPTLAFARMQTLKKTPSVCWRDYGCTTISIKVSPIQPGKADDWWSSKSDRCATLDALRFVANKQTDEGQADEPVPHGRGTEISCKFQNPEGACRLWFRFRLYGSRWLLYSHRSLVYQYPKRQASHVNINIQSVSTFENACTRKCKPRRQF